MVFFANRLRHFGAAALVVATTVGWGVATSSTAQACTVSSHCYGEAWQSASGMDGDYMFITPSCLGIPSGNFVTDEMWLSSSGNTYWVEAGYLQLGSGLNVGGIATAGRYGFWGDNRPGGGFHNHVLETNPSLSGTDVEIYKLSSSIWSANFGGYYGESSSNTMTPATAIYGSETTSGTTHSLFAGTAIAYETGSTWHDSLPSPGTAADSPQTFAWTSGHVNFKAGAAC